MNKKYLVAYVMHNPDKASEYNQDQYAAFVDAIDNLNNAKVFYEELLSDDDLYTANLCEILESTDY